MSAPRFTPRDRIGHYHGQRLDAADLQDESHNESRMRGLHVRASHNTWGIALGFEVTRPSDHVLRIGPGLAYDALGREILSTETIDMGAPPLPSAEDAGASWFDLVAGYDESAGERGFGSGCLAPNGALERPRWRWCYAGPASAGEPSPFATSPEARLGSDVPIVRCRITAAGTIDAELNFTTRRVAQNAVRPHIAGGQVQHLLRPDSDLEAFTVRVNTTAGGFNRTPYYFARATFPAILGGSLNPQLLQTLVGPFVSVRAPSRTGFNLDVRLRSIAESTLDVDLYELVGDERRLRANITWTGIEPYGGCTPELQLIAHSFFLLPPFFMVVEPVIS